MQKGHVLFKIAAHRQYAKPSERNFVKYKLCLKPNIPRRNLTLVLLTCFARPPTPSPHYNVEKRLMEEGASEKKIKLGCAHALNFVLGGMGERETSA